MRLSLPTIFVHLSVLAATAFGSAIYYDKDEVVKRDGTKYVFAHFIVSVPLYQSAPSGALKAETARHCGFIPAERLGE